MKPKYVLLFFLCLVCSCSNTFTYAAGGNRAVIVRNNKEFVTAVQRPNTVIKVRGTVDLKGKSLSIPQSCTILLSKGKIINGYIFGNDTKLEVNQPSSIGVIFKGTWMCPTIDDSFFIAEYLSDDDVISNINYLQNKKLFNTIHLNKDKYLVSIKESGGYSLCLLDSVKLVNNSQIALKANNYKGYSIISIANCTNVEVTGGQIRGDVGKHTYLQGTTSEWGMGINISAAENVLIHDMYISHCTGDGIYITGLPTSYIGDYSKASRNIVLRNVTCDLNRRQGLSIISVDGLLVDSCAFINTGKIEKASPAAGIDIEPNVDKGRNNSVRNIHIKNCYFEGNAGRPFDVDLGVTDGIIHNFANITVTNCTADGPFFFGAQNVTVKNSKFESIIVRPFEAPVHCKFENCELYRGGIIIKKALSHDVLYKDSRNSNSMVNLTIKKCRINYQPSSINKSDKLVYFDYTPSNDVTINFNSCDIVVPNSSAMKVKNSKKIHVSFDKCEVKEKRQ